MKIISNTKDFYDYVAHELGVDVTLRYVRAPLRNNGDEEVSLELPQHVVNAYLADTNSEFFTHVEERQYRFRSNTYGQVCSLVDLPRLKVPIFIGGRVFIAWANSNIDTQIIARNEVECPDWLNEIAKVLNTPVFVKAAIVELAFAKSPEVPTELIPVAGLSRTTLSSAVSY